MEGRMTVPSQPTTDAEYEAAVDVMLDDIEMMLRNMDRNGHEHERLEERSKQLLNETNEILARIRAAIA